MVKTKLILTVLFAIAFFAIVQAREEISGPVTAQILRVVDGDTILVEAQPWPQQKMEVYVRIRGIDAPELKSKCMAIRAAGLDAQHALEALLADSNRIKLTRITGDKYFGRIVANVILSDGRSVADDLLVAGLVRVYDGRRKPREICGSE